MEIVVESKYGKRSVCSLTLSSRRTIRSLSIPIRRNMKLKYDLLFPIFHVHLIKTMLTFKVLQLSVNNSTDESESSADGLKMLDHYHLFQHHHQRARNHQQQHHFQPLAVSSGPAGFQLMPGHPTKKKSGSPPASSSRSNSTGHNSSSVDIATLRISSLAGSGHCEFAPAHFFAPLGTDGVAAGPAGGGEAMHPNPHQPSGGIPTANPLYEGYRFVAYAEGFYL